MVIAPEYKGRRVCGNGLFGYYDKFPPLAQHTAPGEGGSGKRGVDQGSIAKINPWSIAF